MSADPQRHEQAFAILQRRSVISTQIVNEFINVLTGKQRVPLDRVNRCARILLRRSVFDDIGFFNGTTKASDDEFFSAAGRLHHAARRGRFGKLSAPDLKPAGQPSRPLT